MVNMRIAIRMPVTVAAVAATVTASLVGVAVSLWAETAAGQPTASLVLGGVVVVAFTAVGAVVAGARPGNRVGWLLLAGASLWAVGNAAVELAVHGIVTDPGSVAGASGWAVAGSALRGAGWSVLVIGVPMLFPDGRLVGPRWRWVAWLLVANIAGTVLGALTATDANLTDLGIWRNPLALPGAAQPISGLVSLSSVALGLAATIGTIGELRARWRRGGPVERQALTLFAVAAAVTIVAAPVALATGAGWIFSAAALPLPFAIAFGVLAHDLYDLKTAVSRTLVWLTLSAVVAGIYAVVIVGLGGLLDVGGARWVPWCAAAVVAVSFAPMRDGLQNVVNRVTYGAWDQPYAIFADVGQRLGATADTDRLLADVVTELRGLGMERVAIRDGHGQVVAGTDPLAADTQEVPFDAYGRPVGTLHYQAPPTPLRAKDLRLLTDLAGHLGAVLHTRQLVVDLQQALERLVVAREEERRRLRRDLHDGLGPALAGHLLRLDVIASKLDAHSAARADVDALRSDLRATVLEVRRVVEGLRPPALDELGLPGTLDQAITRLTARTSTAIELHVGRLPPLPAAVEVAAYRIITEAVTNTVRHADAPHCRVDIHAREGLLCITVSDDGPGFDSTSALANGNGNGLHTMRERAEELRGRLCITSQAGTTIRAELPLPRTAWLGSPRTAYAGHA